jgi:hypothetical protein
MAHGSITLDGQNDDGKIITQLRALRDQLQAGAITRQQYDDAYHVINHSIGTLCGCKRGNVAFYPANGGPAVCGACYLTGVR